MRPSFYSLAVLVSLAASAAAAPAAPAPAPALARLVVCDDVRDPMTLDPQKEFTEKNHTVVQQIFEGLVRFAPDGSIVPALATSWERVGPDRMRFKLRRGVRFHNGEPFDAESVRFSIARYLEPATGFPALGFISTIERVEVVDPATIDVVTRGADGLLLNRLAGFVVIVEPKHYAARSAEELARSPVGTGAFKLERWDRGRELVLSAFKGYWNPELPKVASLTFRFIPNERQVDALLAGEVDLLTTLPGTRTLEVERGGGTYVLKAPTFYTVAGNFNASRPPLSDARVRRALNLAVDRQALVRYDIFGNGAVIGTLSLPGEDGHDPGVEPYPYDPKTALRLLGEAGYAKGFVLKVLLKANAERTGKIIGRQLSRIGVKLEPTLVTDAELFSFLADRSRWDMAIYDVPDPMHHAYFIRSIFLGGNSPFSLSVSTEVDAGLARVVSEVDPESRGRASRDLDRLIHDRNLALPTYQRLRTYGVRRGVTFTPYLSGMPYFHETSKTRETR